MAATRAIVSSRRSRRRFLQAAGALGAAAMVGARSAALAAQSVTLPIGNGERPLATYAQKRPLIVLTERPPQLETPWAVFDQGIITPNDAFFVRYHLAGIPTEVDLDTFRIVVKGKVNTALSLSVAELKRMDAIEMVAVNQCSGNSRGFFSPRVAGGQLANGAMGNAKWRGVPLKAVLDRAGVQAGAKQVRFDGLDGPVLPATPDFAKALDVDHAMDGEVMIAYAMNDADLPMLNGYPVRLVVPGYFGTYWVKHLNEITVIDEVLNNFWMATAYRIPDNACACVPPGSARQEDDSHQPLCRPLVHHQRGRRRDAPGRKGSTRARHCLRRRLRHPRSRPVVRWRTELERGDAGQGSGQVFVPRMANDGSLKPGDARIESARGERDRPIAAVASAVESGRLHA